MPSNCKVNHGCQKHDLLRSKFITRRTTAVVLALDPFFNNKKIVFKPILLHKGIFRVGHAERSIGMGIQIPFNLSGSLTLSMSAKFRASSKIS